MHAIHRSLLQDPFPAVRGDGVYVVDRDGNRFLDGCGGAAVSCLGHSNRRIIEAISEQVATMPYAHTSFFTTEVLERVADKLVASAPGMGKVLLLSGGSEATEAALKLSRQYFFEIGQPERQYFIARRQSYHGNTLGALGVGGNEWRRRMFGPLLGQGHYISPCFPYREKQDDETDDAFGQRVANELEAKILELGPQKVAGFVAETVVGATAGAVAPVAGYFRRIREICDKYGVHLILDEVMCGTGRTGTFMAYEQEGIVPDMTMLAKGLGAGYQPVGALLCRDEITDAIRKGSGFFQHGHTFMGHATALAASLATLNEIEDRDLLASVRERGASLRARLHDRLGHHPHVGDVRGRGLLIGIEFVEDKGSKKPFDPSLNTHNKVQRRAMGQGLMVYGMGGTIDGRYGDHVLIAPPYIFEESHERELVDKLAVAIEGI